MADIIHTLSVITLYANKVNTPIKSQDLEDRKTCSNYKLSMRYGLESKIEIV